jgi:hypothetical protein
VAHVLAPAPEQFDPSVLPTVIPQLVAGNGAAGLRAVIVDSERYVVEPKVDGVEAS